MTITRPEQPSSWVPSMGEVEQRRQDARRLVGSKIECVRYVDIDYRQTERPDGALGPRAIVDSDEWAEPTWLYSSCHSLDYGVELELSTTDSVSVTWQPPGLHEGLVLHRGAIGTVLRPDANVAVWDVSTRPEWAEVLTEAITGVDLHYKAWGPTVDDGFWYSRITLSMGVTPIDFILGEGRPDTDEVARSADNVAVLFPGQPLPEWEP